MQKQAAAGDSLEDLARLADHKLSSSLATVGAQALDHFLAQPPLQELLQLPSAEFDFDLIIVDYFYTEALLSLGYKHNKPTIPIVSSDFGNYMQNVQESLVPAACSPIDFDQFTPDLGFTDRLANIRDCMGRRKQFHNEHYAAQEQLINKYFKCKYSSDFRPIYAIKIGAFEFPVNDKIKKQIPALKKNYRLQLMSIEKNLRKTEKRIFFCLIFSKNNCARAAGESPVVAFDQQSCASVDSTSAPTADCARRRTSHSWTTRAAMEFEALHRGFPPGRHLYAAWQWTALWPASQAETGDTLQVSGLT